MTDTIFESVADTADDLPLRSCLHPLRPIGLGTALVQSLPSYIHHVAFSHNIPTWALACKILAPYFRRQSIATKGGHCDLFGSMGASTLGNNQTAAETVEILQTLTAVKDLTNLTLLKLGNAVRGPVIRSTQAWCSECLAGFAKQSGGIYQPLLWSMRDVNACATHQLKLQIECPECRKRHKPLTRYRWDGCCPKCHSPLIVPASSTEQCDAWELRVAQRAGDTLTRLQDLKSPIQSSCFASNIRRLCAWFSRGNLSELARQLQVHHSNIQDWINERQMPSLSSLLRVSAVFDVPVVDWLVKPVDMSPRSFFQLRPAAAKPPLRRCDLAVVRTQLQVLVAEHQFPPTSFAQICRQLGTEQTFVARKFPDQARILIDRRKQYVSVKKQMGQQFTKLVVESTFNRLLCDGVRPTWRQMAKCLPDGIALRDRGALDEFNKLRTELVSEFQALQTTKARPIADTANVGKNKVAAAVLDP